jgi:hypothetical protein
MVVAYNDIINAIAKAEDVALYNARARAIELSNGCKPSKEDDDKAIEIESWIQLLTRAAANYDHETCLTDDIIWDIIQNVNEQNRDVDCDVSRTYSRNASSGGGSNVPSGYVERVLGLYVNNTNPSLPIIEIFVDPLTISGDGTQADPFSAIGGGGGATNLGYTASPTDGTVTSSTGTDATLPLADGTNAGLLKPSHFSVLENENQASGYVGTDANNEMFSSYYDEEISRADLITDLTANLAVGGKFYRINDAVGSTITLLVIAESNLNLYPFGIDATTGEIGTYDITTDVFAPIVSSSQTLADTLILGNTSGANDIQFDAAQGILLDNTSRLREGTIDAGLGGLKGIAQICGAGYELKWEAGRLYVMGSSGNTIRQSLYNFTTTPTSTDDNTLGYAVGSLWTLDDGTVYECTDASMGAAVWNLIATAPDLQQVTDIGATTTNAITVNASVGPMKTVIGVASIGLTSPANQTVGIIALSVATSYSAYLPNKSGNQTFAMLSDITSGTVTSVGLSMPSAFSVASSPVTTSGTIAVTGAGLTSQYVRGDGSLANFPSSGGGGASVNYYLNGSVSQGTFGGVAMREINKVPIIGTGTDFTIATNGYIQSFITDANDPNQLSIPAGNWNFETFFSASSGGGSPSFYIELHKWDGTTLTLIATSSATPEGITGGTAIDLYTTALAVPQTTLALTDRLAIRIYVTNSGRTITLHTENSHLCQVITTFTTGLTALNGLTEQVQTFATGTTGTDFAISSASGIHNFNLPTASASNRGALSSADWSAFNALKIEEVNLQDIGTDLPASTYTVVLDAKYARTINELTVDAGAGTCTLAMNINGTPVTGISSVSVSTTETTATATAANAIAIGDIVTIVTTSNSGLANLQITVKTTR